MKGPVTLPAGAASSPARTASSQKASLKFWFMKLERTIVQSMPDSWTGLFAAQGAGLPIEGGLTGARADPDPKAASGESLRHPTARLAGAPDCQSGSRPLGVSCCVGHVVLHMHRSLLCVQTETADEDFQLQTTWRLMASEAHDLRPGGETVITRLADILVIQAIRSSRTPRRRPVGWARCRTRRSAGRLR